MIACEAKDSGETLEITISGVLDIGNAKELKERLRAAFVPRRPVMLNLDAVERLDGAGLQLVLAFKRHVEERGGRFDLVAQTDVPREALLFGGVL